MDFYAAARLFDPTLERAIERSALTPGQLADLQAKASEAAFSPQEVEAARPLAALATKDATKRKDRVAALLRSDAAIPSHTRRQLEAFAPNEPAPAVAAAKPDGEDAPPRAVPSEPTSAAGAPPTPAPARDRALAEPLSKKGYAALEADQLADAERLFHQALREHPSHAGALAGLSEVHFEQGSYHRALVYATKAVDAAPQKGRYHKLLADVYVKVLRYPEAERAYESAVERGYEPARAALERLRARTGKSE
jgi:tetratricopeptide (TPR) repeat protein